MKQIIIIFILVNFINQIPFAQGNTLTNKQEICFKNITQHQYGQLFFANSNTQFLTEINDYCHCSTNQKVLMPWTFQDHKEKLKKQDKCAKKYLSANLSSIVYNVSIANTLQSNLLRKLIDRYPHNVKDFASEKSMSDKIACLHSTILKKCTYFPNLVNTYNCLQNIITDQNILDSLSKTCPSLSTIDLKLYDSPKI